MADHLAVIGLYALSSSLLALPATSWPALSLHEQKSVYTYQIKGETKTIIRYNVPWYGWETLASLKARHVASLVTSCACAEVYTYLKGQIVVVINLTDVFQQCSSNTNQFNDQFSLSYSFLWLK